MPLSFLNPLALMGIIGAVIPLVIHLIQRKPPIPRPFAAMEFILKSHKKAGRRYRIKQILLLIVRMTAVALLALTISSPIWKAREIPAFGETLPSHWVLVIDDSFSMGYGENFPRAKNQALRLLKEVGEKDKVDVLLVSGQTLGGQDDDEPRSLNWLQEKIGHLALAFSPGSIINALEEAKKTLRDSPEEINKRLILITDLTYNSWQTKREKSTGHLKIMEKSNRKAQGHTRLEIIDVGEEGGQPNLAVKDIKVWLPPGGDKEMATVEPKVANYSERDINLLPTTLLLDGKEMEKGFLSIKAGQEGKKRFYYPMERGKSYRGAMEISSDKLKLDDRRYFVFSSLPPKKVLLVNGDPGTSLYNNEVYYLGKALNPGEEGDSPFRSQTITPDGIAGRSLEEFSAVVLSNVGFVKVDSLAELTRFVRDGGGLLITLGDKVIPSEFNRTFNLLLHQKLDKIVIQNGHEEGLFLNKTDNTPAPFLSLLESKSGSLSVARFYNYFSLITDKERSPQTLLALSNATPALIESSYGKGKVLLYITSIDRDWNNLPIQTSYLPFVHQLVHYISKKELEEPTVKTLLVGEPFSFSWDETEVKVDSAKVLSPGNKPMDLVLLRKGGKIGGTFDKTATPGHYTLVVSSMKSDDRTKFKESEIPFVVNLDTDESDLKRLSSEEIEELVHPMEVKITGVSKMENGQTQERDEEKGVALWSFFLFLLAGTLLAESMVANRQV